MVPPFHMQMLYGKAAAHNRECVFVDFPNGMHMDTWLVGGDHYWRTTQQFLEKHVPEIEEHESSHDAKVISFLLEILWNYAWKKFPFLVITEEKQGSDYIWWDGLCPWICFFLVFFYTIWCLLLHDPLFGLLAFMRDSLQNLFSLSFLLRWPLQLIFCKRKMICQFSSSILWKSDKLEFTWKVFFSDSGYFIVHEDIVAWEKPPDDFCIPLFFMAIPFTACFMLCGLVFDISMLLSYHTCLMINVEWPALFHGNPLYSLFYVVRPCIWNLMLLPYHTCLMINVE